MSLDPSFGSVVRLAAEQKRLQDIQDALDPPLARALREQQESLGYAPHLAGLEREGEAPQQRVNQAMGIHPQLASALEQQKRLDEAMGGGFAVPSRYLSPERAALDRLAVVGTRLPDRSYSPPPRLERAEAVPTGGRPHKNVRTVEDIGQRVRAARKAMRMTQQRFADLAGVGRRFLIELERGKPSLEIGRVLAVCQAAGLTLSLDGAPDAHP